ncbi:uncharacterized protein LOC133919576 isoform X2 [Phragmites australis]|uniref:uncharacterized protein LOC133919576 isoform X2 n=1 Tax=Phragmites australis TaxID=29695 RepID=UPI002D7A2A09|nr:uncharacterized protein LOC133919576 isoform X2 [Phragmites australis]
MGKGGELWDDSALVDAFDRAVATFKAMHGKNTQATPCENEKPEHASAAAEEEETDEHREKDDNYNKIPCGAMETLQEPSEESKTIEQAPPLQETDPGIEIHASEFKTLSSDATDADRNVSSSQQGEHTELLRRYYELEEQSRNVLQQLQQTNYWNYKEPEYASMYQQQQAPAYNGDQCPGASTTYTTGANFMQPPTTVSTNDDQVTKVAMMTTEGAFNFMRSTISGDPASQRKETETGKESTSMGMWPNFDTTGADSDLAVVLNAWYAAGFYTGRYLMQESVKNSRQ